MAVKKFQASVGRVEFMQLDRQFVDYIEAEEPKRRKAMAERLLAALRHFFPDLGANMRTSARYVAQLRRESQGRTKPPMIEEVVVQVAARLIKKDFPTTALAVLLQFDCFLRPSEVAGIRAEHLVFPGGSVLGQGIHRTMVLLPRTKTGLLQSVDVRSGLVLRFLFLLKQGAHDAQKLFPAYGVYAGRIATVLRELNLDHIGYSAHSIRHGGATMDLINQGYQGLAEIMYRGRWESQAGRRYLQRGAASLLYAKLPRTFIRKAGALKKRLPAMLQRRTLTPGK